MEKKQIVGQMRLILVEALSKLDELDKQVNESEKKETENKLDEVLEDVKKLREAVIG